MKTTCFIGLLIALSIMIASSIIVVQVASAENVETKKLNLNIATLEELKTLPGMTQETAQAIIKNRPYQKIEDLLKVNGVTQEMLTDIEDRIEVKKVNINAATIKELKALPGITPEMAEAIIEGRPYGFVEELLKIKGIGEKQLTKLQGLIETEPKEGDDEDEKKGWKIRKKNP